jgi:uncharacterized membrane protein
MGMEKNVGARDRTIRVIAGILLLGIGLAIQGVLGLICAIVGIGLLFTAITGFCSLYKLCGINTCTGRPESSTKETG